MGKVRPSSSSIGLIKSNSSDSAEKLAQSKGREVIARQDPETKRAITELLAFMKRPGTSPRRALDNLKAAIVRPRYEGADKAALAVCKQFLEGKVEELPGSFRLEIAQFLLGLKNNKGANKTGARFLKEIAENACLAPKTRWKAGKSLVELKGDSVSRRDLKVLEKLAKDTSMSLEMRFNALELLLTLKENEIASKSGTKLLKAVAESRSMSGEKRLDAVDLLLFYKKEAPLARLLKKLADDDSLSSAIRYQAAEKLLFMDNEVTNQSGVRRLKAIARNEEGIFEPKEVQAARLILDETQGIVLKRKKS